MIEKLRAWLRRALAARRGTRPLAELETTLRHRFADPALLRQALCHRSHAHTEEAGRAASNERLEFLGDAVLGMLVARFLYVEFPTLGEGDLTQLRSALVRRETLADAARSIDLGPWISLSTAEDRRGGRDRESILADAFEAVIGALFLDAGVGAAQQLLQAHLLHLAGELERTGAYLNPKNQLQELIQDTGTQEPPKYIVRSASGPAHDRIFCVEVTMGQRILGAGRGSSKREAEVQAARDALRQLDDRSGMIDPVAGDPERHCPPTD